MTVFTCTPDLDSMMTCIYEAYASRLGHKNIRLQLEPVYEIELFHTYHHIEADSHKASLVVRSIRQKISWKAWIMVYRAALSDREDRLDCIYRFLLLGFHYGDAITNHLSHPAVTVLFSLNRRVLHETHQFREFVRFSATSSNILISHIEPACEILTLLAPSFSDRMPSENWIIIDDNRKTAIIHPADQEWYLTSLTEDEFLFLNQYTMNDDYAKLWKDFFQTIMIQQRQNSLCQQTLLPLRYRKHMTEFKKSE